jgi:hypothetical protein
MHKKILISSFDNNSSVNFSCVYLFHEPLQEALAGTENMKIMIAEIFHQLLVFSKFACQLPLYGKLETKNISQMKGSTVSVYRKKLLFWEKWLLQNIIARIVWRTVLWERMWQALRCLFIYLWVLYMTSVCICCNISLY